MFRIDHPSAAITLPAPGADGTPGYFTAGDPTGGTPATTVTADWANAVQEEIAHVIEGAGIELDKTANNQLLLAINALIAGVGTGALLKANNLSDVTNVATARTNLGLKALALKDAATISDVTGLQGALDAKAPLAGAAFTGACSITGASFAASSMKYLNNSGGANAQAIWVGQRYFSAGDIEWVLTTDPADTTKDFMRVLTNGNVIFKGSVQGAGFNSTV